MARDHSAALWVRLAIGFGTLMIGCTTGSEPNTVTAESESPSAIAVTVSSGAFEGRLTELADELLLAEDLPAGIAWEAQAVTSDFWDESLTFPLTVEWCSVALAGDNEHHYKIVSVPPLDRMAAREAASFEGGRAAFNHVVYADTENAVASAFEAVAEQLANCLDTFEPTRGFTPEAVAEGWYWEADRYPLPQIGDESFAISYSAHDKDGHSTTYWTDHVLAVVRSGQRLILVEMYEGYEDETVTGADFDDVVERAVDR